MLHVGLTGGIASGKSEVCRQFRALGVPVIDADAIAKQLLKPKSDMAKQIIEKHGNLNRRQLRARLSSDPEFKIWLENLTHPAIKTQILAEINQLDPKTPFCIVDIPLLVETGPYPYLDKIIVVDCPVEIQIERLIQRDGITQQAAKNLINVQVPRETRLAAADYIINNTKNLSTLTHRILTLTKLLQKISQQ